MEKLGIVDTSVVISYLRDYVPVADRFESLFEKERVVLSSVTIFELRVGEQNSQTLNLDALFKEVRIVDFSEPIAEIAAKMYRKLESKGNRIGLRDTFIAATAKNEGLPIYTQNEQHFSRIDSIEVIALP